MPLGIPARQVAGKGRRALCLRSARTAGYVTDSSHVAPSNSAWRMREHATRSFLASRASRTRLLAVERQDLSSPTSLLIPAVRSYPVTPLEWHSSRLSPTIQVMLARPGTLRATPGTGGMRLSARHAATTRILPTAKSRPRFSTSAVLIRRSTQRGTRLAMTMTHRSSD
jgi:hypothetical protein